MKKCFNSKKTYLKNYDEDDDDDGVVVKTNTEWLDSSW